MWTWYYKQDSPAHCCLPKYVDPLCLTFLAFISDNLETEKSFSFGSETWKAILDKIVIFVYFKYFFQVFIVSNNSVLRKIDEDWKIHFST